MLVHGDEIPEGSTQRTAVCVVGSGPAGLTVASQLGRAGVEVVLLETGGVDVVPEAQELSQVTFSEMPLVNLPNNRRRQIGGNANRWLVNLADGRIGVRYAPLDPIDFVHRETVDHSGWPISAEGMRPHVEAARRITQIASADFDADTWSPGTQGAWKLDPTIVASKVFQFGPAAAFHDDLAREVQVSTRVTLIDHTTAVELRSDAADGPITSVRCRTLRGRTFSVAADRFVIATSGLGNPHLLLASRSVRPAGIGNEFDLVGRFLQDHPLIRGGSLEFFDPTMWSRSDFYDLRDRGGQSCLGYLSLAPEAIEQGDLAGISALLFPRPDERRSRAMQALLDLSYAVDGRTFDRSVLTNAVRLARGIDYPVMAAVRKLRYGQSMFHGLERGGWSTMPDLPTKFSRWDVFHQVEQRPDPENRVTLNRATDAMGMPTLDVSWRWSLGDAKRAAIGRRLIAEELERAGVGRVTLPDDGDAPGLDDASGTAHYMGTTRMHASPRQGVVDADGRVHSVANLYVAGSSVFTTSGYANPTLTIVALAHRLAHHLVREVTAGQLPAVSPWSRSRRSRSGGPEELRRFGREASFFTAVGVAVRDPEASPGPGHQRRDGVR